MGEEGIYREGAEAAERKRDLPQRREGRQGTRREEGFSRKRAQKTQREEWGLGRMRKAQALVVGGKGLVARSEGQVATSEGLVAKSEELFARSKGQVAKSEGLVAKSEGQVAKSEGQVAKSEGLVARSEEPDAEKEGSYADLGGAEENDSEGRGIYRKGAEAAKERGGKMGLAAKGRKKTQREELGGLGRRRGVALPFNVQGVVDSDPPCPWGANGWRESLFIGFSWAGDSEITSPWENAPRSQFLTSLAFDVQGVVDSDPPCPWGVNEWRESLFIGFSWAGDSEITSPCEKCTSSSSLLFPSTFDVECSMFDVPLPRSGGLRSDSCSFACIRGWNSLDPHEAIQRF